MGTKPTHNCQLVVSPRLPYRISNAPRRVDVPGVHEPGRHDSDDAGPKVEPIVFASLSDIHAGGKRSDHTAHRIGDEVGARERRGHLPHGSVVQWDRVHLGVSGEQSFASARTLTQPKSETERIKLLSATAMGVRRCRSSKGMTGSAAHLSSTNRKTTKSTAEAPNSPRMVGLVHG